MYLLIFILFSNDEKTEVIKSMGIFYIFVCETMHKFLQSSPNFILKNYYKSWSHINFGGLYFLFIFFIYCLFEIIIHFLD